MTADDAGKLPDQNAGETLARVVGVAVTTDQGEGRYVTIRGIDAALSNVTIDGQIIGSPEGNTRRVALDTVPANILSKLEVVKSATPDLDGNAIGGTINLITPSVFDDPDGRFFSATADYGYYDLGGQNPWGGSVGWGNIFNERFGVVLSASYSDREFNSHNVQGGDPWVEDEEAGQLLPDEFVMRDYLIRRVRKGFVANLEFRPNDDLKFHWRNLYNRYEDTELQPEVTLDYRNGDLEDQTATSGTFTEGEGTRVNTERFEIQSILSSTLGADLTIGEWNLAGSFTYGETKQDTPYDNAYIFETADELPMTYDVSNRFWQVDARSRLRERRQLRVQRSGARRPVDRGRPAHRPARLQALLRLERSRRLREVRRQAHLAGKRLRPGHDRVRRLRRRLPAERSRAARRPVVLPQRAQLLLVRSVPELPPRRPVLPRQRRLVRDQRRGHHRRVVRRRLSRQGDGDRRLPHGPAAGWQRDLHRRRARRAHRHRLRCFRHRVRRR